MEDRDVSLTFSARELRDFAVAWVALGFAFTIFFAGGGVGAVRRVVEGGGLTLFVVSLLTAGVAFLVHELAHKVTAVRFGQHAEFRADYSMLFLAVMSALIGFLFAAPGAVHHRGRISKRQHGLIALAGPVSNLVLAVAFAPLAFLLGPSTLPGTFGAYGLAINLFLAAFNLIPYGALDGKTVASWSKVVWVVTFLPSAAVTYLVVFVMGIGF